MKSFYSSTNLKSWATALSVFVTTYFLPFASAQFSCVTKSDSEGQWVPRDAAWNSFSGSNVDIALRHGFNPTMVDYPDVVVVQGVVKNSNGGYDDEQPIINLTTARALRPFIDSFRWDNEICNPSFQFHYGRGGGNRNMVNSKTLFDEFGRGGVQYSAGFIYGEQPNLMVAVALSTPNWNNSYYKKVLPDLIEKGTVGDGCVLPIFVTTSSNRGFGYSLLQYLRDQSCWSFNPDFVAAFRALPSSLGDASAYIDFCELYGWYYPSRYSLGDQSTLITVRSNNNNGNQTSYLLGRIGKSLYDTDKECQDAMPTEFVLEGWNEIGQFMEMEGNVITQIEQIIENFVEFYKTYPVSGQRSPSLDVLQGEQLFTYDTPPASVCTIVGVPSQSPTTSSSSSSVLSASVALIGPFALHWLLG